MKLKLLFVGSCSASFELENAEPYFAPEKYQVLLNGQERYICGNNVFSLFTLQPDTDYTVSIRGDGIMGEARFHTKAEHCAIDVRAFGVIGDGVHDDSAAMQSAIACLPAGGRLLLPPGDYLTRPLFLKSHMTLELQAGARLIGWPERRDYPILPGSVIAAYGKEVFFSGFEGDTKPMYQSLLTAQYCEDICIVGPGIVDGNAQNGDFWTGFAQFPAARPRLLFFNRCKNVTIHGIHACNSPSWQLHPYYSKDIGIYDVQVSAPKDSPNTDAIDPESCDGVEIIGCRLTVGDDCIAVKSGKIDLGTRLNRPAANHVIRNCLMEFGHGAVTLGSEIGAGVQDLQVSRCCFRGTDRGLRIKSRRGRGKNCRIDGVSFENIRMEGVLTPIAINLWYNCCDPDRDSEYVWTREPLPVDGRTPYMGAFHFKGIHCTDAEVAACYIDGLPEAPIDAVSFEDVSITFAPDARPGIPIMQHGAVPRCRLGFYLDNVRRIRFENVAISGADGNALLVDHCETLETVNLRED